jgi:transposase
VGTDRAAAASPDPTRGGRPGYDRRLVVDTILDVLRAGCAWRVVPHDLVPWWVAYRWFRAWRRMAAGTGSTTGCGIGSAPLPA